MVYRCLECGAEYDISQLLYTCPKCKGLFLLEDKAADRLKKHPGAFWRRLFDYRKMLNVPALKGIHLFYELITPVIPLEDIIYLGEGHTPQVAANEALREEVGAAFYFKNDGQNPSASFKDRGMAAALSYLNYLVHRPGPARCWPSAPPPATPPRPRPSTPLTWANRWPRRCSCPRAR